MHLQAPTVLSLPPGPSEFSDHYGFNCFNWWGHHPGIYQIFVGDQSYVGKARRLGKRITARHHWAAKADRIRLLTLFKKGVSEQDLHNAEAYWIELLRPELNIAPVNYWSKC